MTKWKDTTIGSYTESLAKTIEPQKSYLQSVYNDQYDRASIQHSTKRIMVSTKAESYKSAEGYNPNAAPVHSQMLNQQMSMFPLMHQYQHNNISSNSNDYIAK
eukprot:2494612-Ditylum_brightwellii.AAC.1